MKVTLLGTGTSQGVPVIACGCAVCRSVDFRDKRLRCSVHLEVEGLSLVVDTGPDFRQQMLRAHIQRLDAILFTHAHKDHIAGLDDVRPFNFKQQADMPVYGRRELLDQLMIEFAYVFAPVKYPGIPNIELREIGTETFWIGHTPIVPIQVMHHRLTVLGFRVHDFAYITDANFIAEAELAKLAGTKVLVINALRKEPHISHFNLAEALEVIERVGPERAYITHLSHQMGLHAEVSRELPSHVALAYDGLQLEL
jgi:phosphoribosyl 1,2-cyclic phosphate phosphodiesterase